MYLIKPAELVSFHKKKHSKFIKIVFGLVT